jgi:energy-coupling factor transporter transmembrane protein EcfT
MTEIIGYVFLFCAGIVAILIASCFVFFLFSEYPVRTNLVIIIFLLILGVPIFYIPVIYLVAIALICATVGFFVWIFSLGESKNVVEQPESPSEEEAMIDIENKTIIEAKIPVNSIFIEELNNISHNINYTSHPEIVLLSPPVYFNSNHNQGRETVGREVFKEHNLPQIYDSDNYEDDELCLKQEYIITFPVTKIVEPSRLVALEIDVPDLIILKNGQERVFTVFGIDQLGVHIDPGQILWSATGGKIDSQGKLIVNAEAKGHFKIVATSYHAKISRYNSLKTILMIKISLKIFSFILSKKRFIKDVISYFIQEFCSSKIEINDNLLPESEWDITEILSVLIFDNIKDWVIEAVVNIIIDYLDKFISLCFVDDFDPLVCYKTYIVLPELKSQESLKVIETVANSFGTLSNNDILAELRRIRIVSYHKRMNSGNAIRFKLLGVDQNGKRILIKAPIVWETTDGQISSTGRLILNNLNDIIQVTATVGQLDAKTNMRSYRRHYTKLGTFTQY